MAKSIVTMVFTLFMILSSFPLIIFNLDLKKNMFQKCIKNKKLVTFLKIGINQWKYNITIFCIALCPTYYFCLYFTTMKSALTESQTTLFFKTWQRLLLLIWYSSESSLIAAIIPFLFFTFLCKIFWDFNFVKPGVGQVFFALTNKM